MRLLISLVLIVVCVLQYYMLVQYALYGKVKDTDMQSTTKHYKSAAEHALEQLCQRIAMVNELLLQTRTVRDIIDLESELIRLRTAYRNIELKQAVMHGAL